MNFWVKLLTSIRSWPDEARRFLAGALVLILGAVIFVGWYSFPLFQLTGLTTNGASSEAISRTIQDNLAKSDLGEANSETASKILSPLEGVAGVLKDLKGPEIEKNSQTTFWRKNWHELQGVLKSFWNYIE